MPDSDATRHPHVERSAPGDPSLGRALALVRFLRAHCPWDARQTPESLRPYLLEEAHEVAEAIEASDDAQLEAELGDLLLNVAFQIVLGEERGSLDADSVVERLEAKMVARHPHVYGDADAPPDWEEMKRREREASGPVGPEGPADPFDGVPAGLDPLSRAARVQERMAAMRFDWPDMLGPLAKLREEIGELEAAIGAQDPESARDELGDVLFAAVNLSRHLRVHATTALLGAVGRFERRCRVMLDLADKAGLDWSSASLEQMDAFWDKAKARERPAR